ncbi:transposase [Streptomyces sp. NPDC000941]
MSRTLGLLLGVMVTAANIGDRTAAKVLLEQVAGTHHRLALVRADGGYTGSLVGYCLAALALVVSIVRRSDGTQAESAACAERAARRLRTRWASQWLLLEAPS